MDSRKSILGLSGMQLSIIDSIDAVSEDRRGLMAVSSTTGLTEDVAAWAASLTCVPDEVNRRVRLALLDILAAAVAGAATESGRLVIDYANRTYAKGNSTVIGSPHALAAPGAALANGTSGHALDVDDGYTAGNIHPSVVVLPAVLALAEAQTASAEVLLAAAAAGIEFACRVAAAGHPAVANRGFHTTPLAGVLGAALGCARVLGLSPDLTASAIGLAASHAGGLFEFLGKGAEVKRLHAGKAARDGVLSAELAGRGLTGPPTALEGSRGYFKAFSDGTNSAHIVTERLGERWRLLDTYFKLYPCCRHLHTAVEAAIQLRPEIAGKEVTEIAIGTYGLAARHSHTNAETLIDAQMSMPFVVASALRHGELTLRDFSPEARRDPATLALMRRVRVFVDPEAEAGYPTVRPASLNVTCADGSSLSARVELPLGEPSRPLSEAILVDKVRNLCEGHVSTQSTECLIQAVLGFQDSGQLYNALRQLIG